MTEIKEIDMKKYLVWKWEDIQELPLEIKEKITFIESYLREEKYKKGKIENKYLVLNLEDNFSIRYLFQKIALLNEKTRFDNKWRELKIENIAVDIVNAILISK